MKSIGYAFLAFASLAVAASASTISDPWADTVVSYTPGENVDAVFGSDPQIFFERSLSSLGAPTRVKANGQAVTPFNPASDPSEVVSIGDGGSLTVAFDEPVTDDPLNPFGIDLLIFSNSQVFGADFPANSSTAATGLFAEGGQVFVSADNITYVEVVGLDADGLYPTAGFLDFELGATSGDADFTLPVDPSYDPLANGGDTPGEIYAAYNGSGGGAGVDIGALGLSEISYVRIVNPVGGSSNPEIDAFADVQPASDPIPEPAAAALALLALAAFGSRRP